MYISYPNGSSALFVGRNGCFPVAGLHVNVTGRKMIELRPLTLKGHPANCCIDIDPSIVGELIEALETHMRS